MWVDTGNVRFDGSIYTGTTHAMNSSGLLQVTNQSNIAGVGTITSGTWEGTDVGVSHGGTGASSATAGFDALSPMTAEGDILYGGSSGTVTKLAKGSDADVLTLASGVPSWATPTTGDITSVVAGAGMTGGSTSGDATLNVIAGTGIDVTADAVAVDVSDFMANGANNYVVTATGTAVSYTHLTLPTIYSV